MVLFHHSNVPIIITDQRAGFFFCQLMARLMPRNVHETRTFLFSFCLSLSLTLNKNKETTRRSLYSSLTVYITAQWDSLLFTYPRLLEKLQLVLGSERRVSRSTAPLERRWLRTLLNSPWQFGKAVAWTPDLLVRKNSYHIHLNWYWRFLP